MNSLVKTREGDVRGRRADGVHVFKGIPTRRHRSASIGSGRRSRSSRGAACGP